MVEDAFGTGVITLGGADDTATTVAPETGSPNIAAPPMVGKAVPLELHTVADAPQTPQIEAKKVETEALKESIPAMAGGSTAPRLP